MIERKVSPPEEGFTPDYPLPLAYAYFQKKNGYAAEYHRINKGLLLLGPIYAIRSCASESLAVGSVVLVDGLWHTVSDIDGQTVLDSDSNLLELESIVKVRA